MFVRTKNAIYEISRFKTLKTKRKTYEGIDARTREYTMLHGHNIIAKSRKLTDLFDECIQYIPTMYPTPYTNELHNIELTIGHIENHDGKVYGAIWVDSDTQPTLKSVAKYENGKWVLL